MSEEPREGYGCSECLEEPGNYLCDYHRGRRHEQSDILALLDDADKALIRGEIDFKPLDVLDWLRRRLEADTDG